MKKKLLIFALFFNYIIFAQDSGVLIYRVKPDENKSVKMNILKGLLGSIPEVYKERDLVLSIKNNKSYFKASDIIFEDSFQSKAAKMLESFFEIDGAFLNSDDNIVHEKKAFGQNFQIEYASESQGWNLTEINKVILGKTCYKATKVDKIKNSTGVFEKKVTAWFAPSIPFNFGPSLYGGLPGLILEVYVESPTFSYYFEAVSIRPDDSVKIPKKLKGKIITKEEFDEIGIKTRKNQKVLLGG